MIFLFRLENGVARQPLEPAPVAPLFDFDHPWHRGARWDRLVSPKSFPGDRRSGAQFDRRRSRGRIDPSLPSGGRSISELVRRTAGARSSLLEHGRFSAQRFHPARACSRVGWRFPILRRDGNGSRARCSATSGLARARSSRKACFSNSMRRWATRSRSVICEFTIAGALRKMPGEASAAGSFAPRVYIPLQDLDRNESPETGKHRALPRLREVSRRH